MLLKAENGRCWRTGSWRVPRCRCAFLPPHSKGGADSVTCPEISFLAFSHIVTCASTVSFKFMTFQTKLLSSSTLLQTLGSLAKMAERSFLIHSCLERFWLGAQLPHQLATKGTIWPSGFWLSRHLGILEARQSKGARQRTGQDKMGERWKGGKTERGWQDGKEVKTERGREQDRKGDKTKREERRTQWTLHRPCSSLPSLLFFLWIYQALQTYGWHAFPRRMLRNAFQS